MEASTFIWTATCSRLTITFDEAVKEKKPMPPMIVPEAVQEEAQQDA